ncbi:MAG: epoxide hydrolase family protein [Candidatus Binatia bacterium]
MQIEPFRIAVPDAVLTDLRQRLAQTRFPDEIAGVGWAYGVPLAYMKELVGYWRDRYDWRRAEAALNQLPHFRSQVGDLGIHFIHVRGRGPKPMPLVITHGWPGSVLEMMKIIGPLTDPAAHGGDAADAFDVVCPSLPGYAWSDAPRTPGADAAYIAGLWAQLMRGLGYERFGAQGGDWGAVVTALLGQNHADVCAGIHMNMVLATPPDPASPTAGLTEAEIAAVMEMQRWYNEENAYMRQQSTRPQTLGYGLNDSPAGLAAWIIDKFHAWSDCGGDVESRFTRDELLTNVTIYWVTQSITSSFRIYYESYHTGLLPAPELRVRVPTGCAIFPKEIVRPPRSWVAHHYNLQRWSVFDKGGHFAAMEEPRALIDDVRAFFRPLRSA